MKKILGFLAVVLVIALLVYTCPDKKSHKEALKTVVTNVASERIDKDAPKVVKKGFDFLGPLLVGTAVDVVLDSYLDVKNYFVVSIGEIYYKGEQKKISVGLLGHVFTINEEQLQQAIDKEMSGIH